jgi:hypothetical protein
MIGVQSERDARRDEMNVMTSVGEFHAELGGEYAGTSDRWIAQDPDA